MTMFYLCPVDGPVPVDYVNNGVGYTWHGIHCGWGHEFAVDDLVSEDAAMDWQRHDDRDGATP